MSSCYLGPIPIGPPHPASHPQTHYVLVHFTACGRHVDPTAHTPEPTCPECQAWLERYLREA